MTTIYDIERLFKMHYRTMLRLAQLMLHDDEAARDIVHDVFESMLSANLSSSKSAEGYLLRAVRNRCLNYRRGLSTMQRIKELYAMEEEEIVDEHWPDEETLSMIRRTIDNDLSPACRRVMSLRFADNESYREIAIKLGISEVAVYKHLRHALDVLRSKFSENG